MADIRNIKIGSKTPEKRIIFQNGEATEIKRSYKIVNSEAVIIWDISSEVENQFITVWNVTSGEFTFPKVENTSHTGLIDWGDGTIEDYDSSVSCTHMYSESGRFTISIECDVQSIAELAFASRTDLIYFRCDTATEYGRAVFAGCTILSEVTISNDISTIPVAMFSGCTMLNKFTLPLNLNLISSYAFNNCSSLTELYVDCKELKGEIFTSSGIQKIVFSDRLKSVELVDDITSGTSPRQFEHCINLRELQIGESFVSLEVIPSYFANVFEENFSVETIRIAEGVKEIKSNAFRIGAYGVAEASIYLPSTITTLGSFFSSYTGRTGHSHKITIYYNATYEDWQNISKKEVYSCIGVLSPDVYLKTTDFEKAKQIDDYGVIY